MKIISDETNKYYNMLNSFRADLFLKIEEILDNRIAFGESYFDIEKRLIKNKDENFMNHYELLEELEFDLRHENLKIVRVDRDKK